MSDDGTQAENRSTWAKLRLVARPGVIGSLVLHGAVLGLLLYQIGVPPAFIPVIPVELVQFFEQTTSQSPQPDAKAALPSAGSSQRLASVAPPRTAPRPAPRPEPAPVRPEALPSTPQPAPDALTPPADRCRASSMRWQSFVCRTVQPRGREPAMRRRARNQAIESKT